MNKYNDQRRRIDYVRIKKQLNLNESKKSKQSEIHQNEFQENEQEISLLSNVLKQNEQSNSDFDRNSIL